MGRLTIHADSTMRETLVRNGWRDTRNKGQDYEIYTLNIECYGQDMVLYANVSRSHNDGACELGVCWVEVKYQHDGPFCTRELKEMQDAIEIAENNLLTIGMPFIAGYRFNGKNRANKKRANEKLRRKLQLDEAEKEAFDGTNDQD